MKAILPAAALALALAACSSGDEPGAAPDTAATATAASTAQEETPSPEPSPTVAGAMTLTPTGLGSLAIGKTPAGSGWVEDEMQISDECRTLHSDRYPESYAMSDGKTIRRITIGEGSKVKTERGIGPGSSEADVRKAYPGLVETTHHYVGEPAKYLDWLPSEGGPGLRFETGADRRVSLVHAGLMPWLGYIEGCA